MRSGIRRGVKKAAVVGAAAAAILAATGGTALASASSPASSQETLCFYFDANGVRIHSNPNVSSTTVGLGYEGQGWCQTGGWIGNGYAWSYGEDTSTGTWGWVVSAYLG
jgi:hypothetical protein